MARVLTMMAKRFFDIGGQTSTTVIYPAINNERCFFFVKASVLAKSVDQEWVYWLARIHRFALYGTAPSEMPVGRAVDRLC